RGDPRSPLSAYTTLFRSGQRGQQAEALACRVLEERGLRLIHRNWRCRRGELDLVMLDGDTVVFVEVRYRRHTAWGGAIESIDWRKRQRLAIAAQLFLQKETRWANKPSRCDLVTLGPGQSDWIRNAFDA